ncbi:MAG: hypothetical protein RI911_599 [Candidatus Parcubacteria bacterium]
MKTRFVLALLVLFSCAEFASAQSACPDLRSTLKRGMRDAAGAGQVSELQFFLAQTFSLAANDVISGFFGPTTERYVRQYQNTRGISATGVVGPLTRARIAAECGGSTQRPAQQTQSCPVFPQAQCRTGEVYVQGSRDARGCVSQGFCRSLAAASDFYASPEEGVAPLSVAFYAMVGGKSQYAIDYGDGSALQPVACYAPAQACVSPGKTEHTYNKPGTYVASLKRVFSVMELQPGDKIPGPLATVTIKASEKKVAPVTTSIDPTCRTWTDGCNTCTRLISKGPLTCTERACATGVQQAPRCQEYFAIGKTDYPPSLTLFTGPTQLNQGEVGTWRLEAKDPEGQQLSYSIDWGDVVQSQSVLPTVNFSQSSALGHAYTTAGVYTISVAVFDTAGGSVTSSAQVTVGGATNTTCTSSQLVCGERTVCSPTQCWQEQRTFSSLCEMRAAQATQISEGECQRGSVTYTPPATCQAWFDGCNTCSRSSATASGVCTQRACTTSEMTAGYCSAHFATAIGSLQVQVSGRTVTVTGPSQITEKMNATYSARAGCGYILKWGDGTTTPTGATCPTSLSHTYTYPGTYNVNAELWHPGPSDAHVTDWKDFRQVVIQ